MPKRDWSDARSKVEAERVCRVCGSSEWVEAAHVTGRLHDEPKTLSSKTLYVKRERIVPLCGSFSGACHNRYDAHELDLLGFLTPQEEAQAVLDLGSIESARRRLCPSAYRFEVST